MSPAPAWKPLPCAIPMNSCTWMRPHAHSEPHVTPTHLGSPESLLAPTSMHMPTFCAASARIAPRKRQHTFMQDPTCSHACNTVQIDTYGPQHTHTSGHICRGPYVVLPRLSHQISNPYSRHWGLLNQYRW